MSDVTFYVIMYSVISSLIYTTVILIGIYKAKRTDERVYNFVVQTKHIVEEIKNMLKEEHTNMNKGQYKNTRSKEENKMITLTELLSNEPTDKDYEEILDLLSKLARETYEDYKFLIAKSSDETEEANFLQIVSNYHENPELHKQIFQKAIKSNVDRQELVKRFALRVAHGEVIDLGEDVIVIVDDNSGQPPTGVSPINSGLEGGEIAFIISFIKKENYDEWEKKHFPEEEEASE